MNLADVAARIRRLDVLFRGLAREEFLWKECNDPLLYVERQAYLSANQEASEGNMQPRPTLLGGPYRRPRSDNWAEGDVFVPGLRSRYHLVDGRSHSLAALSAAALPRRLGTARHRGTGAGDPHGVGAALKRWWGISTRTAWSWRRCFGVSRLGSEGSRILHQEVCENAALSTRGGEIADDVLEQRIKTRKGRGYPPPNRWEKDGWKPHEVALLGTMGDTELANKLARTRSAVRSKRVRLGIPPYGERS